MRGLWVCWMVAAMATVAVQPLSAQEPPPASPAPAALVPPTLKKDVQPVYPDNALADRVAARVTLDLEISAEGFVDSAAVVEATMTPEGGVAGPVTPNYGFEQAAQVAASQLEFNPATQDGTAIPVRINYTFNFVLPAMEAPEPVTDVEPVVAEPEVAPPAPQQVVNYRGTLVERGTRGTLTGVIVTVYRGEGERLEAYEATSDENGQFEFYNLGAGEWQISIEADGYYKVADTETIKDGELVDGTYYLERQSYNPYDVIVEADRPKKEVTRRTLVTAEIDRIPGTLGDPVLVVENLPGVARPPVGTGNIVVRGSGPEDTGINVDGVRIPLIYHFGGLRSVLPSNVIESIDFYPGNYSVEYGRALGGIFDAHIRRLTPDKPHGMVDVSLLDTSLFLEVPVGDKAAIAFAGRRSYIDGVLNFAIPDDSDVALTQAPVYWDYQVLGNWRPKPKHDVRFLFLGSDDRFELLFSDPAEQVALGLASGEASAGTQFQRVSTEYRYVPSQTFKNRFKLAVGRDKIDFDFFGEFILNIVGWNVQARDTATWTLDPHFKLNAGVDALINVVSGNVRAPQPPTEGEGGPDPEPGDFIDVAFDRDTSLSVAPFVEAEVTMGALQVVPGLRVDYFQRAGQFTADPRVVMRYLGDKWLAKAGVGWVHQEAPFRESQRGFGNPDLEVQAGIQYSVGGEWKPKDHLSFDVTLFYKDLDKLTASSDALVMRDGQLVPEIYSNERDGRVYGAEVFLRHNFANNFRGWVSYTLSRAERFDPGEDDARLFDFDQTHIFALVAAYRLPRNWELGLRWRLVSGNPYTPAVGAVFVDEEDEYVPIAGDTNSSRLDAFQQLDLRVDKSWIFDTWKLSAYLSLVNTYNHKNVEAINYNYDYSEQGATYGLPIFPILGVRGDF